LRVDNINVLLASPMFRASFRYGNLDNNMFMDAPEELNETIKIAGLVHFQMFRKQLKAAKKDEDLIEAQSRVVLNYLADMDRDDHIEGDIVKFDGEHLRPQR
jgi:hypothetical protein